MAIRSPSRLTTANWNLWRPRRPREVSDAPVVQNCLAEAPGETTTWTTRAGCFRMPEMAGSPVHPALVPYLERFVSLSTTDQQSELDAARLRPRIDAALDHYTQFDADCPPQLAAAIRYALLAPGKRLRPQ